MLVLYFPYSVSAYSARSLALVESTTGTVLDCVNSNMRMPMASTTKIMTALVVLETLPTDMPVTVPAEACGVEGSSIYLKAGEVMTVSDLLYGLLLASGNDAASALAIAAGGSVESFVSMMNERAASLGLKDTHFTNPSGLPDDDHYTTAYELALITCTALRNATFSQIVSTESIRISGGRLVTNHNKLLWMYEHAVGVKTGFTKKAGRCLVSAAKKDDVTLVCVTLNAPDDWNDHIAALDYGFSKVQHRCIARRGDISVSLDTPDGKTVTAVNTADVYAITLADQKLTQKVFAPRFIYAPKALGQTVAVCRFYLDGRPVASVPLCLESPLDIQVKKQFSIFNFIKGLFK